MERRAFLAGVAGTFALAGAANAAPLARSLVLPGEDTAEMPAPARTPDGTPVENAQVRVQIGQPYPRGYRRRRSRMVCRREFWRGRWVRRCRRVYW